MCKWSVIEALLKTEKLEGSQGQISFSREYLKSDTSFHILVKDKTNQPNFQNSEKT